jgi:hypothetical protein
MHGSRDLTVDGRAKPGSGVGRFCCELIKLGIREEKIAELAGTRARCGSGSFPPDPLPSTWRAAASGAASRSSP